MDGINIQGIDKAVLLAALYDSSQQIGMGFLHTRGQRGMSEQEAKEALSAAGSSMYFDYLHGRVMKVKLAGDTLDPGGYDRDNGQGAAARVVQGLRAMGY